MSRPRWPAGGFGFALDYDKEVAADLALLEDVERCLERGLLKPDTIPAGYAFGITDAALAGGEWLALTAWATDLLTEEAAKRWRKKAKADLARHRRNKLKYGR